MDESILDSIKHTLNIDKDDHEFDGDIILHTNSVFATLNELGIGPEEGFEITGSSETWSDYLSGNLKFSSVRTYVYLRVRLLLDPPTTGYHVESLNNQIKELEWRLNVIREDDSEWRE